MPATLLALHGFSLNGAVLRAAIEPLTARLSDPTRVVCPDAPHQCPEASVERLYTMWKTEREPVPYRRWWDASDDGSVYEGWDESRDLLRGLLDAHQPVGVLGFSQGAMVAAALAALSARGEAPPLAFVILVAGRIPRADVLRPLFDEPVHVPSLHVWGESDTLSGAAPEVPPRFDPATCEVFTWPGPHVIPTRGPAADAIVGFALKHGA